MIHTGHPVGLHGGLLFFGVLAAIAFDFHNQVQQVVFAVAVLHQHDEVRDVAPHLRAVAVGHFEAQVLVFNISSHAWVRLGHAAELGLPIAIENHPVDVAAAGIGLPAGGLRRVEVDVEGGADGVVRVKHRLDRPLALERARNAGGDALAGHVGQLLVHQLSRIGAAFADQAGVEPFFGDALELTKQM